MAVVQYALLRVLAHRLELGRRLSGVLLLIGRYATLTCVIPLLRTEAARV